jgi:cold shock CspA family protein/ribosome-associated translation inhibitor RaiA
VCAGGRPDRVDISVAEAKNVAAASGPLERRRLSQIKAARAVSVDRDPWQVDPLEPHMQTPVEIDFQGIDANSEIRGMITAHVEKLEQRFARITACRVVLKGPGAHHRQGGLHEVNIRLTLPNGRAVDIGRTALADERYADLRFAINDAFRRARRQLQDRVCRLQGQIKIHAISPIATVARLDPAGTFGFLETSDGREIYFHRNSVIDDAFSRLATGTRVTFVETEGERGPQASTVKILGKHRMRA